MGESKSGSVADLVVGKCVCFGLVPAQGLSIQSPVEDGI